MIKNQNTYLSTYFKNGVLQSSSDHYLALVGGGQRPF